MSTDSLSPQTQRSESRLAVETVGLDVIAEADRKGKPADLFMPWFAANISVLGISWGAWVLGFGLSLVQALLISVVGLTLSFLLCGLVAIAGKRGSAPTLVLSRAAFWLPRQPRLSVNLLDFDRGLGNFPSHYGGASYRHRDGSPGL